MPKTKRIIALLAAAVAALTCASCGGYVTETRTVFSSGIVFSASLSGGDEKSAIADMLAIADELDASVNINRADSLLSAFNASENGETTEVDRHAYYLAVKSKEIYLKTDGAFDPSLGAVSRLWEVDADGINAYAYGGAKKESLPDIEEVKALGGKSGMDGFTADEKDGRYYLTKTADGVMLDFGGVAKGYLADECRKICKTRGVTSALIKISGNIYLIGDYRDGNSDKPWGVGVINPRGGDEKNAYVCGFYERGDVSVVTSGDYERSYDYTYGGETLKLCHIIDGKTAMPIGIAYDETAAKYVQTPHVISATIVGESSMLCDAYATAACVLGGEKAAEFLGKEGYRALIFTSDGKFAKVGEFDFSENETLYKTEYTPL